MRSIKLIDLGELRTVALNFFLPPATTGLLRCMQQFLYFFPDPQGQGSLRPTFVFMVLLVI